MKYALIIGNNRYSDRKLAQLKTPAADSQALARVLTDANIGSFDNVIALINKTEFQVSRAISAFLSDKKPEDLVLVYFSGHGVLDDRGRLFLALKDTDTGLLKSTAIPASFISDEMDSCRSKRQILILDCCHSGAFERGVKGQEQKAVTETTFEGNGFGRVVLTASASTQYALEGSQVIQQTELSLFTHFLLEGLQTGKADADQDGYITLDEWYDYTFGQVVTTTPKQVPHKWSYRQQGDLIVAKNPFAKKKAPQLPEDLLQLLESPYSSARMAAVKELGTILHSRSLEYTDLARAALERLSEDDSRVVSAAAIHQLTEFEKLVSNATIAREILRQQRVNDAVETSATGRIEKAAPQAARGGSKPERIERQDSTSIELGNLLKIEFPGQTFLLVAILGGIILLTAFIVKFGGSQVFSLFSRPDITLTPTTTPTKTITPIPSGTSTPTLNPTMTITSTPSEPFPYIIQEGDSLESIAQKFNLGTDGSQLIYYANLTDMEANNGVIFVGQTLTIPPPGSKLPTTTPIPANLPRGTLVEYRVLPGDTLAGIAFKFNSIADNIIMENNIENANGLVVGQVLQIPVNLVTPIATLPPSSTPVTPTLLP